MNQDINRRTTSNMPFAATTTGPDTLGLRSILEDFANGPWITTLTGTDEERAIKLLHFGETEWGDRRPRPYCYSSSP